MPNFDHQGNYEERTLSWRACLESHEEDAQSGGLEEEQACKAPVGMDAGAGPELSIISDELWNRFSKSIDK